MVARRGTNGQVRGYTNCLTSTLACTDDAEVGGSIPTSPTTKWDVRLQTPSVGTGSSGFDNDSGARIKHVSIGAP
jgi:hypothetical protein